MNDPCLIHSGELLDHGFEEARRELDEHMFESQGNWPICLFCGRSFGKHVTERVMYDHLLRQTFRIQEEPDWTTALRS